MLSSADSHRVPKSAWIFPAALLVALIVLTILEIHGSSIGIYHQYFYNDQHDKSLLLAKPRSIRSDEWLVTTQMTLAQERNQYKSINGNIGNGQDMSFMDVPIRDWTTIFKPQNLPFFFLPLGNAFALKWWLILAFLLISCYFLFLFLTRGEILLSVLLAIFTGLSPMIFWWYQSGTVLTVAYSALLAALLLRLLVEQRGGIRILIALSLVYVLICFAFIFYPPFQIPCLIAAFVLVVAWAADAGKLSHLLKLWPYWSVIILVTTIILGVFYLDKREVIGTITNTVYPGQRISPSGDANPLLALTGFLLPDIQDDLAAAGFFGNQSEVSSFILVAPFLFLPSLLLLSYQKRKLGRLNWLLISTNALVVLFLAKMFIYSPSLDSTIYKWLLLDRVPSKRVLLGLGVAGIFQLLAVIHTLKNLALPKRLGWFLSGVGVFSAVAITVPVGLFVIENFPDFMSSHTRMLSFALIIVIAVFLLLRKRLIEGLVILVLFSAFSIYKVHPFYRGLDVVTNSKLMEAISSYPNDKRWVTVDDIYLINFPLIAGKPALNGVHYYPQLELWRELDPAGELDFVYNRYSQVSFSSNPGITGPIHLLQQDAILVKFDPCGSFLQENASYVLSPTLFKSPCLQLDKTITYPARTFYIYKINQV